MYYTKSGIILEKNLKFIPDLVYCLKKYNILHGKCDDMLVRHCDNERLSEKNERKIGF